MAAQPLNIDAGQIAAWAVRLWWPVLRVSGFVAAAPLLSQGVVPRLVRVAFTVALAFLLAPLAPVPSDLTIFSGAGALAAVRELLIGISIGMVVQMSFEALALAGQTISMTMGLGFATLVDPLHGANTTVVGQLVTLFAMLTYLALNGHVLLLSALAGSFQSMPIGAPGTSHELLGAVIGWGGHVFAAGLLIALPAVISLLIVNMALGVITRAAPQLNLFAVGFPLTLLAGFTLLILGIDTLMGNISGLVADALAAVSSVLSPLPAPVP